MYLFKMVFLDFSGYIPRSGIVGSLIIREMQIKTTMSYHYLEWPSPKSLLLLLSHFSRVRLCVIPHMAAHQAPPSLGFSRQEHWSGLPFPSPMHESEKWKWSSVVSNPQQPHGLQPTRLLRPCIFQARILEWGAIAFSRPKSTNNKCWQGCGERETLVHCWWGCKLVQPPWRIGRRFL